MAGPVAMIIMLFIFPFILILYNRHKVKGKILGIIVKKDKSVLPKLCELKKDFLIFQDRAYEVYPDFVRVSRYPMGWPAALQELVPALLLDEEDRVPLDWIHLGKRQGSAMELRSALDENWVRKLVEETAREGAMLGGINWRKVFPFILLGLGIVGLVAIFILRSKAGAV